MPVHQKDGKWYWGSKGPFDTQEKAEEVERAAYANGYAKDSALAFDRASVRTYDADGMLHVSRTPISKANICTYYGKEVPGWQELGLDPEKAYRFLRAPEELSRAAETFNNKPLLDLHEAVNILNPPKDMIVGSTGTDAEFVHPYLYNSLVNWDANSIAGIEASTQREISSSYRWRPDMTPGEYEGEAYDGVMRDIVCNHVAIVPSGRAGPDVFVYDSQPTGLKLMSKIKSLMTLIRPYLANDEKSEEVEKKVEAIIKDEDEDKKKAEDEMSEEEKKKLAEDEESEKDKKAEDEAEEEKKEKEKMANDSKLAMDAAVKAVEQRFIDLRKAERDVRPVVGELACDSAEEVYRTALKQLGCDEHASIPAAALSSVFKAYARQPSSMAQDSAVITTSSRENVKHFFEGTK